MLVLKRNHQEKVILKVGTETIVVTIVQGQNVRLGFDASRDVQIVRPECFNNRKESA